LTAELYKVNLNGNKTLFKAADMYAGEFFSDGNYLMISTIQKPFSYIVPLSRFLQKTIYYKDGKEVKVVSKWPRNYSKGFGDAYW
jgi:hypothetical protein